MGNSLSTLSDSGRALYDKIAAIFGADNVVVTSTKRNTTTQHGTGDALDFYIKGVSNRDAVTTIANSGIEYNQLIDEISGPASSGAHIHIGAGTAMKTQEYVNGKYLDISGDVIGGIGGIYDKAVEAASSAGETVANVADTATGGLLGWLKELFSYRTAGRFAAVVIGVILIGLAIAAFALTSEAKIAKGIVK